jgi:hypothetical protein
MNRGFLNSADQKAINIITIVSTLVGMRNWFIV